MKTVTTLILFCIVSVSVVFPQESVIKKYHPLSGRIGISLEGGTTVTFSDFRDEEFDYTVRLLGEYFFQTTRIGTWGVRFGASWGYLKGSGGTSTRPERKSFRTTKFLFGGSAVYILAVTNQFLPYASAGVSYLYYDPRDLNGNRLERNKAKDYSRHEYALNGEIGMRYLFTSTVSFNIAANINYVRSDNLDDVVAGSDFDIFYEGYAGFTFYFGGTKDTDEDGVDDADDICPNTPKGIRVDQFGCPVDTDADGVPDYLDKCPNTPANIQVTSDGCPVDSDGDGVPDYIDVCNDTPENVPVDKRGCPLDEDKDGVPDYRDRCPKTPAGAKVDKWGCTIPKPEVAIPKLSTFVLTGGVIFDVGKSTLLSGAKTEIDKIIKVMNKYPETRWRIEGHTDSTGSYARNKQLSLERANAVADYLAENGIDKSRLEVVGLGPDFPIAENSTETGRAMNRRVSIELIKEEE